MPTLQLPEASLEDCQRCVAEFESASKHGYETRDAMIRLIWAQVHTNDKRRIREGVKSADRLMQLGVDESRQLTYLAAVGEYKLGKAVEARQRLKTLLETNPEMHQAKTLLDAVDDKLTTDTLVAGGALAVVGAIAGVAIAALAGGRR